MSIVMWVNQLMCPFPARTVASISGAGQQHAMILFSRESGKLLSSLDSNKTLADQLPGAFSSPTVTNWQDSRYVFVCLHILALPSSFKPPSAP